MKKIFLAAFVLMFSFIAVIAEQDFVSSFKNCSPFTDSGTVNTEGMNVTTRKQIVGWNGDRCLYKETVNFQGMNVVTACKFTKPQLNEITSVMNAYSLVQKYSSDSVDTSSVSNVQNNPVVKVWNKYLQDGSTCVMSGLK